MRRLLIVAVMLAAGACSSANGGTTGYSAFSEIDPDTSPYFIAMEGTALPAANTLERLWAVGVATCEALDDEVSIDDVLAAATLEVGERDAPILVAAAVGHLCDQHRPALEAWIG